MQHFMCRHSSRVAGVLQTPADTEREARRLVHLISMDMLDILLFALIADRHRETVSLRFALQNG
jgi:hypothetical protein